MHPDADSKHPPRAAQYDAATATATVSATGHPAPGADPIAPPPPPPDVLPPPRRLRALRLRTPEGWVTAYADSDASEQALYALAAHFESFPATDAWVVAGADAGPALRVTAHDGGAPGAARGRLARLLEAGALHLQLGLQRVEGIAGQVFADRYSIGPVASQVEYILRTAKQNAQLQELVLCARHQSGAPGHFRFSVWAHAAETVARTLASLLVEGVTVETRTREPPTTL